MENYQHRAANQHISKQNQQSISICSYYLKTLFPTIFKVQSFPPSESVKIRAINRSIAYNYSSQTLPGLSDLNEDAILQAGKLVYFSNLTSKIKENSFQKTSSIKHPYLPIWREISEQIEVFTVKQNKNLYEEHLDTYRSPNKMQSRRQLQRRKSHHLITINKNQEPQTEINCSLYIIHYGKNMASDSTLQWENFIEKYTFAAQSNDGQTGTTITYQTFFSFYAESSLLNLNQSQKFLQAFYEKSIFDEKDPNKQLMPTKFINKLRTLIQIQKNKMNQELQSVSFDASHRRELTLTQDQKIIFNNLKVKTFAYFGSINRKRQINRYFLENLICRMMSNQNYKEDQSWEAIKYYIDFQKRMRDKYTWSHFQKYDKMNIFTYIGKDMLGRPILLNRLRNNLMSKIQDFDDFFDYHMYLFEIYMQDQMEGWVDQFVVISDASNQVSDNTNLGFTKRILMEGYKITLGRPYKIVVFDISLLGTALCRILRPILPQALLDCVKILGDDRAELLEELRSFISDQAIPEFLGGKNQTLQTKSITEQRPNTDITSERSTIRSVKSSKNL